MRPTAPRVLLSLCALALAPMTASAAAAAADTAAAPKAAAATANAPQTDEQKTLYTLGLLLSRTLQSFQLTQQEMTWVTIGLNDGTLKRPPLVAVETYGPKVQELQTARMNATAAREKVAGKAYLDKAAAEAGATRTASGIVITTLKAGTGATPLATDQVKVHYEGKLVDGTVFDSSVQRGEPATFPLNGVIKCWTESVQLLKVGGKSRVVCPSDLAYGDRGAPPRIPGGAVLVFEIELLDIVKEPARP
jgi:FKBP-type peptidyl-prolyl cis-trans isomerase